jgi:Cation-independent mannose-6-phosphate receptor repeat
VCLTTYRLLVLGFTSKLFWNNGQIRFTYEGEKCDEKHNYTTHVMLHCDYAETKNDYLGVIHSEKCEINIIMRTPAACLSVPDNLSAVKMTVKSLSNETLDFSPLKTSNHQATGTSRDISFYISFPVMYSHDILCGGGTSVCLIDNNEKDPKKKYKNVGMMTSDIHMIDDEPVLKLSSSEKCESNNTWSSEITFKCDDFSGEGSPKYKGSADCVHKFEWETNLACAKKRPCQIITDDGRSYDFSSLSGITYKAAIPNKTNEAIFFSVCGPAKDPCDSQWGSCIVKTKENGTPQQTSTGIFSTRLEVEKKSVFLKYSNGAICNKFGRKFSTKIEFVLADDKSDEAVVLVEDECDIVIQFKTLLAANYVKNCVTKNQDTDEEVDLRRLINFDGNYIADVNELILPNETGEL